MIEDHGLKTGLLASVFETTRNTFIAHKSPTKCTNEIRGCGEISQNKRCLVRGCNERLHIRGIMTKENMSKTYAFYELVNENKKTLKSPPIR